MKKFFKIIVPILLTAFILFSIFWYCFIYDRNFTRDMLLTRPAITPPMAIPKSLPGSTMPRIISPIIMILWQLSLQISSCPPATTPRLKAP